MKNLIKYVAMVATAGYILTMSNGCVKVRNTNYNPEPVISSDKFISSEKRTYNKLPNGSEEIYIGSINEFRLYQDFDGDGKVDRIITNSKSLNEILVREKDFKFDKEQFEEADRILLEEKNKSADKK
ncbi:MAG: hypothetical protein Q8L27_01315 [archaeon]|nr:hypothetical protein [archaeon]